MFYVLKGPRLIWVTLAVSVGSCMAVYYAFGINEEIIRLNIRITARISFVLFSAAFVASALAAWKKSRVSNFLMQNRRYIGLSFGCSHIIHLMNILLLLFLIYDGDINGLGGLKKLTPAMTVYVYIFVMMITSNNLSIKLLGTKTWTWLHRLGMYVIAAAIGIGFYKVVSNDSLLYGTVLTILILEIMMRVYVQYLRKLINGL